MKKGNSERTRLVILKMTTRKKTLENLKQTKELSINYTDSKNLLKKIIKKQS